MSVLVTRRLLGCPALRHLKPLRVASLSNKHDGRFHSTSTKISEAAPPPPRNTQIPGPTKWDAVQAVLNNALESPSYKQQLRQEHGDVVKLWVFQDLYLIFDPEIFLQMLRQEWSLPHGAAPETWPFQRYYKKRCSPETMPMMLRQGESWKKPRQTLQTHMFAPKAADSYQPGINTVVDDAARNLRENPVPKDLNEFLCFLSFEMLAQILLDRRMGLLDGSSGPKEKQFVSSAVEAFHRLGDLVLKPPVPHAILQFHPIWKSLETNMDQVWDLGMEMLEEAEKTRPEEALVTKLAEEGKMDQEERLVNLVTILQAGVDTTSNSLAWALYSLANCPDKQERLRQELRRVLDDGQYSKQHLSDLPYLKAFTREVHRLTPTAAGTMRRIPFAVDVGGYEIPPNSTTLFSAEPYNLDESLLGADPNEFNPDRWLAANEVPKNADPMKPVRVEGHDVMAPAPILSHPLLSTPFGVGPRMCVGARVAQNEINSVVSKICHDFVLTMDGDEDQDIQPVSKLVMTPQPAPRIRFDPVQ